MSQYISYDLKFGHFLPCPITAGDKTFFINLEIKKNDNAYNHRQLQYVYQFEVLYLLFTTQPQPADCDDVSNGTVFRPSTLRPCHARVIQVEPFKGFCGL